MALILRQRTGLLLRFVQSFERPRFIRRCFSVAADDVRWPGHLRQDGQPNMKSKANKDHFYSLGYRSFHEFQKDRKALRSSALDSCTAAEEKGGETSEDALFDVSGNARQVVLGDDFSFIQWLVTTSDSVSSASCRFHEKSSSVFVAGKDDEVERVCKIFNQWQASRSSLVVSSPFWSRTMFGKSWMNFDACHVEHLQGHHYRLSHLSQEQLLKAKQQFYSSLHQKHSKLVVMDGSGLKDTSFLYWATFHESVHQTNVAQPHLVQGDEHLSEPRCRLEEELEKLASQGDLPDKEFLDGTRPTRDPQGARVVNPVQHSQAHMYHMLQNSKVSSLVQIQSSIGTLVSKRPPCPLSTVDFPVDHTTWFVPWILPSHVENVTSTLRSPVSIRQYLKLSVHLSPSNEDSLVGRYILKIFTSNDSRQAFIEKPSSCGLGCTWSLVDRTYDVRLYANISEPKLKLSAIESPRLADFADNVHVASDVIYWPCQRNVSVTYSRFCKKKTYQDGDLLVSIANICEFAGERKKKMALKLSRTELEVSSSVFHKHFPDGDSLRGQDEELGNPETYPTDEALLECIQQVPKILRYTTALSQLVYA